VVSSSESAPSTVPGRCSHVTTVSPGSVSFLSPTRQSLRLTLDGLRPGVLRIYPPTFRDPTCADPWGKVFLFPPGIGSPAPPQPTGTALGAFLLLLAFWLFPAFWPRSFPGRILPNPETVDLPLLFGFTVFFYFFSRATGIQDFSPTLSTALIPPGRLSFTLIFKLLA